MCYNSDIFEEQKLINVFVHDLATTGELLKRYDGSNGKVLTAHVHQATQHLDVSGKKFNQGLLFLSNRLMQA